MKIGILGAGFSGLELGRRLKQLGLEDFAIFEKEPQIGGLCRTNKTGEYYWDFAVHAIYSRSKEAMDHFYSLPLDYQHSSRNVKILHCGSNNKKYIIDYPFENGVRDLPSKEKMQCILGYLLARTHFKRPHNLLEWIDSRLGFGIAKYFMVPYNEKIWSCSLSDISLGLVDVKIEPASAINFVKGAFGGPTVGRQYQSKFIYPRSGIQELIDHTAKEIKGNILLNENVDKLSRRGDKWIIVTSSGREASFDTVVSTIPLPELLRKLNIDGVKKEYDELKWNDTFFVMVGLKKGSGFNLIKDCHWVFFKEDEIFYRVTLMHNFSNIFPPALVAEVTNKGDILNKTEDEIKHLVIRDLIRAGIINTTDDIVQTDIRLLNYTYPIPTIGLKDVKDEIRSALAAHNLFLLGRNGNWDYINMDGVFLDVKDFTQKILSRSL